MSTVIFEFEHFISTKLIAFYCNIYSLDDISGFFLRMHEQGIRNRDRLAERFFKANADFASFACNHSEQEGHYRFIIAEDGNLIARELKQNDSGEKTFSVFFTGHYAEFVNRYSSRQYFYLLSEEGQKHSLSPYLRLQDIESRIKSLAILWAHHQSESYRDLMTLWIAEYRRIIKTSA